MTNLQITDDVLIDPIKHKGYGLSHIIDKHEEGIKRLGFRIEDFIPIIVQFGSIKESDSKEEFLFESNYYRIVVEKRFKGREKQWVLTAFDLRKSHENNSWLVIRNCQNRCR